MIYDDLIKTDEVGDVRLAQRVILIGQAEWGGSDKRHVASRELESETLLVNRLQEPASHVAVDLEDCSLDCEYLIRVEQMFGLIVAHFF